VTFEEGICAGWLHDLLHPRVVQLMVSNPRKNALLKYENKSDRIDSRKLAELLRGNHLPCGLVAGKLFMSVLIAVEKALRPHNGRSSMCKSTNFGNSSGFSLHSRV